MEHGRSSLHARRPPQPSRSNPTSRARRAGGWQDIATSTPGRIAAVGLLLALLALGSGMLASRGTDARQDRIHTLRLHSEPLANAAQDLYSSLSVADATAGAGFLAGGLQPIALLDRYNSAIGSATTALTTAAVGVDPGDADSKALLAEIGGQIPIYTGLVATANANNRAGNPVGVNYLSEASNLMQGTILPRAQQLYRDQSAAVAALDRRNATLDWAPLALTALTLVALVYFQIRIARQSRRVLNFGLAPATFAMGVLFAWLLTAGLVSNAYSHQALTESSEPLSALTSARILGQQARTDETLGLLQRASSTPATTDFDDRLDAVSTLLGESSPTPTADAAAQLDGWRQTHQVMRSKLAVGDYHGAVAVTVSDDASSSGSQFAALDASLSKQIDQLRSHGQEAVDNSYRASALLAIGSGVLSVIAALLIGMGLWPRLNEYQ